MNRPEAVSILAGGYSVKSIDLSKLRGTVICINDSAIHSPKCDVVCSMDRLWTEGRWEQLRLMAKPAYLRRSAVQKLETKWPWCHIFDNDNECFEFTDQPGWLQGTNSGLCGFNLAYQWRPRSIYLLGFDMTPGPNGEQHWYPPYPWITEAGGKGGTSKGKYVKWAGQFNKAQQACLRAGIQVFNVTNRSMITVFQRMSPEEYCNAP